MQAYIINKFNDIDKLISIAMTYMQLNRTITRNFVKHYKTKIIRIITLRILIDRP